MQTGRPKLDKPVLKKFKKEPKYPHHRSEGLTHRHNKGTVLQPLYEKSHG